MKTPRARPNRTRHLSVVFPDRIRERIKSIAKKRFITPSQLIRECVVEKLFNGSEGK